MAKNEVELLSKYKHLFYINSFQHIFKKNIDDFIRQDSNDPKEKGLSQQINEYIKSATNGRLEERTIFKNYLKTKLLTDIDIYEFKDGKPSNVVIENLDITQHEEVLNWIIPFDNPSQLTVQDKFEILLNHYRIINEQGYDEAFKIFKNKHNYVKEFITENGFKNTWHEYTEDEIHHIYEKENIQLEFKDKVDIITQRLYQEIYGLSVIDILSYSDINEVGISNNGEYIYAWCDDKIHLSFIRLTEDETRLIQDKAISFNEKVGQLDSDNSEVICYRADNARILALQQPYSSSRNLSTRIFNKQKAKFNEIIKSSKQQLLLQTLLKMGEKISLQGSLGAGKTTGMQTFLEVLDDSLHIGTVEDTFEQHNRLKYPNKRIVEVQSTHNKDLLDAVMTLFRASVDVASLGEARDGEALFAYIQLAQAIGNSTLFTTHVASPEDSVPRFKNMLISTGKYFSEQAAVADIVNYINIICQHEIIDNKRVISQIVEIVPLIDKASKVDLNSEIDIEELQRMAYVQQIQTNTSYMYRLNPLMVYENGEYKFLNYPSERLILKGMENKKTREYMMQLTELMEQELGRKENN